MKFRKEDLHPDGRPLTKEEFINKIKTDDEFAKEWGELGPIYGKQWRKWRGQDGMIGEKDENGTRVITWNQIDQIANLINNLKTNPDSRRLMVSAWNVSEIDQMVLPPCHYSFQVYTRELSVVERMEYYGKHYMKENETKSYDELLKVEYDDLNVPQRAISLMWNQRSVDTPLGLPFNIASYGLLLEILGKIVNMVPDELIGNLGDCHIYLNQIEGVKEQIDREPLKLPKLKLLKTSAFWDGFNVSLFNHLEPLDFQIMEYKSHPSIKMPLSN